MDRLLIRNNDGSEVFQDNVGCLFFAFAMSPRAFNWLCLFDGIELILLFCKGGDGKDSISILINPLIEEAVGYFLIFSFMLKTSNHHQLNEEGPVWNSFVQTIFRFYLLVFFQDALLDFLEGIGQMHNC